MLSATEPVPIAALSPTPDWHAVPYLGVWCLDLRRLSPGRVDSALDDRALDDSEWQRAQRLRVPRDRRRFEVAHLLLRSLLGRHLGVAPGAVTFTRERCPRCGGPNGRPALWGAQGLHFSLSTSRDLILLAVASAPVGVDIEHLASADDDEPLMLGMSGLMHAAEQRELGSDSRPASALTRLWTRKEAYLKATGAGIVHGVCDPYVGAGAHPSSPVGWVIADLRVPAGCAAAVAVETVA